MHSLPLFHRIAGQSVIVVGEGEAADAKRRLIERASGRCVDDCDQAARLAFVALDAPEAKAAELKARGVLVNVVDRPDLCDFTMPSVLERGPVVVAVGTGGTSAGLAKALRLRLETLLPQSLGKLAQALGQARAQMRQRWPDPVNRRVTLDAALAQGGPLDPLTDFDENRLQSFLDAERVSWGSRVEFTVSSDDPEELTIRQARMLGSADTILHDPGVAPAILARARADAARYLVDDDTAEPQGFVVVIRRS